MKISEQYYLLLINTFVYFVILIYEPLIGTEKWYESFCSCLHSQKVFNYAQVNCSKLNYIAFFMRKVDQKVSYPHLKKTEMNFTRTILKLPFRLLLMIFTLYVIWCNLHLITLYFTTLMKIENEGSAKLN